MLAPVPKNLARWLFVNEAKRAPIDAEIAHLVERIAALSPEGRGYLVGLFRAAAYPFNKERERRRYAEALIQLLSQPVPASSDKILGLLQEWHDFLLGKVADMEFLKTANFTMRDARDLLEKTQVPLSMEDKAFLSQIADKCQDAVERTHLQKIFVDNAVKSQEVRSKTLQAAFFEQYASEIAYVPPAPEEEVASTPAPLLSKAGPSGWWFIPRVLVMCLAVLLFVPTLFLSLCQVAVGWQPQRVLDWFVLRIIQNFLSRTAPAMGVSPVVAPSAPKEKVSCAKKMPEKTIA